MKWVSGRLTRVQTLTRPEDVWPEVWLSMSREKMREEIRRWEKEKADRTEARKEKNFPESVDDKDGDDGDKEGDEFEYSDDEDDPTDAAMDVDEEDYMWEQLGEAALER